MGISYFDGRKINENYANAKEVAFKRLVALANNIIEDLDRAGKKTEAQELRALLDGFVRDSGDIESSNTLKFIDWLLDRGFLWFIKTDDLVYFVPAYKGGMFTPYREISPGTISFEPVLSTEVAKGKESIRWIIPWEQKIITSQYIIFDPPFEQTDEGYALLVGAGLLGLWILSSLRGGKTG